jgi:membrane protein
VVELHFLRSTFEFLKEVYNNFNRHRGSLLAAGIAFFIFFSLIPLLLFSAIALAVVLTDPAVRERILDFVLRNFPALTGFARQAIDTLIRNATSAGIIATLGFLWSGTNLFGGIAIGLNAVYETAETRNLFIQKLIAIGVYLVIAALIILSFGATALASLFRDEVLALLFPGRVVTVAWTALTLFISTISSLLLFLAVYKLVPNVKLSLRSIWLGTLVYLLPRFVRPPGLQCGLRGSREHSAVYVLAVHLRGASSDGGGDKRRVQAPGDGWCEDL